MDINLGSAQEDLVKSGLPVAEVTALQVAGPVLRGDFALDAQACSYYFSLTRTLLEKLPVKPKRNDLQERAAHLLLTKARSLRESFLSIHVAELYSMITERHARSVVAYDLPYEAARIVEGLTPTREQVAAESILLQKDKDGVEIDQGIFFAHVLANEEAGSHLCHTMLLPGPESAEKLLYLQKNGAIDLGFVSVETKDSISWVTMKNSKYLNAEDNMTLGPMDEAIDLAIMDPQTTVAVLRGGQIDHPKYNNRAFCSGINLSHLYQGKIPFLWYMKRELGFLHKIFRGLALPGQPVDDVFGSTLEKIWISQVDSFAIGSGCQFLLPTDYIIAGSNAYLTLPASKEGIIPGVADLRLHRFVGDRMARQLIMMARRLECNSPQGQLICDEVVDPAQIEQAVVRAAQAITSSGLVAVKANRRAFRVAQEPLNLFRQYMSVYAREQAYCHFSKELIHNLEIQDIATKKRD